MLGIHGAISYGVAERTREFGIRMALGSPPGQVKAPVIRDGIKTALAGLLSGAAALARLRARSCVA
ncbi:MAG TPA: FtsX-like permease family protein [Bryobacteraceae bacterium]|nr:FtsX-like permease family protein [Bryobacteraceae bacterium]